MIGGVLTWALLAGVASAEELRRVALLVGSNDGGEERVLLRYAESDAQQVRDVLVEVGGVSPDDAILLLDPTYMELEAGLKGVGQIARAAERAGQRVEVIVYYSGHADDTGLLPSGRAFGYGELRAAVAEIPAAVKVTVLDSCGSGAVLRTKGGTRAPPFLADRRNDVTGVAFLASSTADEASQESDRIGASFFTWHLVAGLRGAADADEDGLVTISEAYNYTFRETRRSTADTLAGPQHPTYSLDLSGQGDLVLTDLRSGRGSLLLDSRVDGQVTVRAADGAVVAQVQKVVGRSMELSLLPGDYSVVLQSRGGRWQAPIVVDDGGTARLAGRDFLRSGPLLATRLRGSASASEDPVPRGEDGDPGGEPAVAATEPAVAAAPDAEAVAAPVADGEPAAAAPEPGPDDEAAPFAAGEGESPPTSDSFDRRPTFGVRGDEPAERVVKAGFQLVPKVGTASPDTAVEGFAYDLLWGRWHSVVGLEMSTLASHSRGDLLGTQLSGLVNVTGDELWGAQLSGLVNVARHHPRGLQMAGLGNLTTGRSPVATYGGQVSGLFNVGAGSRSGGQIAGGINLQRGNLAGAQLAGLVNHTDGELRGAQLGGLYNGADLVVGVQIGALANSARHLRGAQLAAVNVGDGVGAQLGVINVAGRLDGVQVGLLNVARTLRGEAVGLLSFIGNGYHAWELGTDDISPIQTTFKFGSRHFYSLVSVGYDPFADGGLSVGFGFGAHVGEQRFSFDADVSARTDEFTVGRPILDRMSGVVGVVRPTFGVKLAGPFGLYVGPQANVAFRTDTGDVLAPSFLLPLVADEGRSITGWLSWHAGLRLRF